MGWRPLMGRYDATASAANNLLCRQSTRCHQRTDCLNFLKVRSSVLRSIEAATNIADIDIDKQQVAQQIKKSAGCRGSLGPRWD